MFRQQSSRRDFLKGVAAASGAALAVPYFVSSSFARQDSANDKLNVGAIGTSIYTNRYTGAGEHAGRGAVIGHQAGAIGNMIAVADVNLRHARFFAKEYDPKIEIYQDYRKLLERKDIDVVTIGTPDHWHVKVAIDALRAGKHVYCEKPLTLTVDEGKRACQVAKETGLVFQVGTQQRSEFDERFLKAVVLARSGRLGDNLQALSSVGTERRADRSRTVNHRPNWTGISGSDRLRKYPTASSAATTTSAGGWSTPVVRSPTGESTTPTSPAGPWVWTTPDRTKSKARATTPRSKTASTSR